MALNDLCSTMVSEATAPNSTTRVRSRATARHTAATTPPATATRPFMPRSATCHATRPATTAVPTSTAARPERDPVPGAGRGAAWRPGGVPSRDRRSAGRSAAGVSRRSVISGQATTRAAPSPTTPTTAAMPLRPRSATCQATSPHSTAAPSTARGPARHGRSPGRGWTRAQASASGGPSRSRWLQAASPATTAPSRAPSTNMPPWAASRASGPTARPATTTASRPGPRRGSSASSPDGPTWRARSVTTGLRRRPAVGWASAAASGPGPRRSPARCGGA